jgi:CRP-like cAMP-binding protein
MAQRSDANLLPFDGPPPGAAPERWPIPPFLEAGRRRVPAGTVLAQEGRRIRSLFVVDEGAITLAVTGRDGRRSIVGLAGPGDAFGTAALHPGTVPIWPEARSLTSCTLVVLSVEELRRAMVNDPSIGQWLGQASGRAVADLQARLWATLSLGAFPRTLALLRMVADRWGREVPSGIAIDLPLSQETLASMAGLSRETVNRALGRLRASGAILMSGRRYVIPAPSGRTPPTLRSSGSPPHPAPA